MPTALFTPMATRNITADFVFTPEKKLIPSLVIRLEEHKILEVTSGNDIHPDDLELFQGILCPGFINCHTHLELSHLRGKIPEKQGIDHFIDSVMMQRKTGGETVLRAMERAENEMIVQGIVAVGDISNSDVSFDFKKKNRIYYHTFIELFGFDPAKAVLNFERGIKLFNKCSAKNTSLTIHAPYSVSPELLKMVTGHSKNHKTLLSIHNQESRGENKFFISGEGPIKERFEKWNLPVKNFEPTGKNSLPSILEIIPHENKTLLVHNTFTNEEDVDFALSKNKNLFWCICPRANLFIENQLPDVNMFRKKNAKICIGTDSLASNFSLSVMEEIKTLQHHFTGIPLEELLTYATIHGAEFLGIQNEKGNLEKGKKPGINLIRNLETETCRLREDSWVQVVDRP